MNRSRFDNKENYSGRSLTLFFLASFLILASFDMQSPTLSLFAVEVGASLVQVGVIVSLGFAVRLLIRVPIGLVSDRLGEKPIFLFGAICSALCLVTLYASTFPSHIMLSQIMNAFAFIIVYSIGMTMAEEMYRGSSGVGVSAFASASSTASLVAPLLCSVLLQRMSIRMTYFIGTFIGLSAIACSVLLPKNRSPRASLEIGKSLQKVLKNKGVLFASAIQAFFTLSQSVIITFFPLQAFSEMGLSASEIALLLSMFPLGMTLIRIPLPKVFRRINTKTLLSLALLKYTTVMFLMPTTRHPYFLALLIGIAGIAHGIVWPAVSLHLSFSVDRQDLGLANSIYGATGDAIGIVAPIVLGAIIGQFGYSAFYYTVFCIDLTGLVVMAAVIRRIKNIPSTE